VSVRMTSISRAVAVAEAARRVKHHAHTTRPTMPKRAESQELLFRCGRSLALVRQVALFSQRGELCRLR
jgi:hypothetical protein